MHMRRKVCYHYACAVKPGNKATIVDKTTTACGVERSSI